METIQHLVAGAAWTGQSERFGDVYNPAMGKVHARVALASSADVDHVVAVARGAQPAWGATPPAKRAQVMFAFRDLLNRHDDELAEMISKEHC